MSRIRGKDTTPERLLRSALFRQGYRFRKHSKGIPGRPDVVHKGAQLAVFVDGCFWHGCPRHYRAPKTRREFWDWKIGYNRDLRKRKRSELERLGWLVLEMWECEVLENPELAASRVGVALEERKSTRKTH